MNMSEQQSCKRVCGDEFPGICGSQCNPGSCSGGPTPPAPTPPTPAPPTGGPSRCGCSSCTSNILNRIADGHTVLARIDWVKANMNMSEQQSCKRVCGDEFPGICGSQCNPSSCGGGPTPPSPTPPSPTPPTTGGGCSDNPSGWYDSDGPDFNCAWYSMSNHCQRYGDDFANRGKTANQACCTCGGGSRTGPTPTPPSPSPPTGGTRPRANFNESLNSSIRNRGMLPYLFDNKSRYNDNEVYVAVTGRVGGNWVWLDLSNFSIKPMSSNFNTVQGPSHDNSGWRYANIFRPLSSISSNTIGIPKIEACKMFISFRSPLYIHFHAGNNAGYTQPNLENSSDPNRGIRFETIELTWVSNGLWINTSRVDAYQYPMGLEVYGSDVGGGNNYKKVGELKDHNAILNLWPSRVSSPFLPCYVTSFYPEGDGIIKQPSKIPQFDNGGASANYFQAYINQIWNTYKRRTLKASFGDIGIWQGQVSSNNVFTMRCVAQCPGNAGAGRIRGVPNTQEIIEAKGKMAQGGEWDKNVQKMFSAAINRHAINPNASSSTTQNWGDNSQYFQSGPYNDYVAFFHGSDISFESQTYAFAYDDVFDQSSTIQATRPDKTRITIGGFYNVQGH